MSTRSYRATVIACALSWLMVGLHAPILHQMISHGRMPDATVLIILIVFTFVAIAALVVLLRVALRSSGSAGPGPAGP